MRRGKDYRLGIVLDQLASIPGWKPCDRERLATDRALKRIEEQWVLVVAEQENITPGAVRSGLPAERVFYMDPYSATQTLVDRGLAILTEAETHALAEDMAMHGTGAVSASEIRETVAGNDATLYPNRWMRVPDSIFVLYGRLEDRRP